mmetsp:Transcript_24843/g.77214  ORF Transcript_24843/g.77214 Transcript_24843/m.77214 type:complete len:293 (-) Transcript_24843:643-1521(-)
MVGRVADREPQASSHVVHPQNAEDQLDDACQEVELLRKIPLPHDGDDVVSHLGHLARSEHLRQPHDPDQLEKAQESDPGDVLRVAGVREDVRHDVRHEDHHVWDKGGLQVPLGDLSRVQNHPVSLLVACHEVHQEVHQPEARRHPAHGCHPAGEGDEPRELVGDDDRVVQEHQEADAVEHAALPGVGVHGADNARPLCQIGARRARDHGRCAHRHPLGPGAAKVLRLVLLPRPEAPELALCDSRLGPAREGPAQGVGRLRGLRRPRPACRACSLKRNLPHLLLLRGKAGLRC